jgi:hypothetical protein
MIKFHLHVKSGGCVAVLICFAKIAYKFATHQMALYISSVIMMNIKWR